jgi:hypothetical protein
MDRYEIEAYEERYGEEAGRCNIHQVLVVDRSCPQCEDAERCIEGDNMYSYEGLPESLRAGMRRYIEDGIGPGGFLTTCLENDLMGALRFANNTNLQHLEEIVEWIYWESPHDCWGSKEKVAAWLYWR